MKKISMVLVLMALIMTMAYAQEAPRIQLAILLDTSNSMDGLISQAKGNLWTIINQFAKASRDGKESSLEIALYEYGNDSLSAEKGYIRQVLPFSTNLDNISEELFRLTTNGGSEYCAMAIQSALSDLSWSRNKDNLKAIYIAGNEKFTQGPVHFEGVCRWAKQQSIIINTIHCGDYEVGIRGGWKAPAVITKGNYLNIDQNRKVDDIVTPYDEKILILNSQMNNTYVPYGVNGEAGATLQSSQDSQASSMNSKVLTDRAAAKASKKYRNESWDLVDAFEKNKKILNNLKQKELPKEFRNKSQKEIRSRLEGLKKQRMKINKEIQKLNEKRNKFIQENQIEKDSESLDSAIIKSAKGIGGQKGFSFE